MLIVSPSPEIVKVLSWLCFYFGWRPHKWTSGKKRTVVSTFLMPPFRPDICFHCFCLLSASAKTRAEPSSESQSAQWFGLEDGHQQSDHHFTKMLCMFQVHIKKSRFIQTLYIVHIGSLLGLISFESLSDFHSFTSFQCQTLLHFFHISFRLPTYGISHYILIMIPAMPSPIPQSVVCQTSRGRGRGDESFTEKSWFV